MLLIPKDAIFIQKNMKKETLFFFQIDVGGENDTCVNNKLMFFNGPYKNP